MNWRVEDRAADRVAFALRLHPQPGFPFVLDLRVEHVLDDAGLTVRATAVNVGATACPFGAGAHPYLAVGDPLIDTAHVTSPSRVRLLADERGIPTGEREDVAGTPYDLRRGRVLGDFEMDTAFTDLEREADGRAWGCAPAAPTGPVWACGWARPTPT